MVFIIRSPSIQMTAPTSGVKYRIQSVDFLTYIEALAGTDVGLRPAKESGFQYWQFETASDWGFYNVRNVGISTSTSSRYLYCNSTVIAAASGKPFSLARVWHEDDAYRLSVRYSSTDYYVHSGENGASVKPTTAKNDTDSQKWRLIPVTSSIPIYDALQTGNYCIRNLNGRSFLMLPDKKSVGAANLFIRSQRGESDKLRTYQRWIVTRQESGEYTIQNASDNSYLGCTVAAPTVGDSLVGSQNVYLWNIQSVGGFAWSLRIPTAGLSVGVAHNNIEDGDKVSLVSSDDTSSQIWLMDKYIPLGKVEIHAKREVDEGTYLLQSAHTSVYMRATRAPWRIASATTSPSKFNLKYVDENSAHFTLTHSTATTSAVVADAGGYVGLNDDGTEFVLLEKDEGDLGYVICRADPGYPHKVVSARIKTDSNGNSVFSIDNKEAGLEIQMWKLFSS